MRSHRQWGGGGREGHGQDHGRRDAALQGTRGREVGEPNRARGVGRDQMTPELLETLEFPEALARVAAHAAGPLGAARIAARQPSTDAATIRAALAQVAELAALLITDDSIRAEPVPDITVSLELLDVPGSALEGPALAELTVALAAMRVTAADLKRIGTTHDARRTASLRVDPPPRELETTLVRSIAPDGAVLDSASRDLAAAEQREVLRVLRELTDLLRPQRDTIAAAWEMCIAFDDLCARARYAVEVNGFVPEIGGHVKIRGGRHPLLSFAVPFDLELAPDEFTILVSGPNTGGKTVLIKAVGLLSLLAQSGIVPPIGPHSSLPVFTEVFADIGDRQSIAASLSTFSAHVAALREILDGAGPGSLVLLDEIGSGTDPAEGGALAAATLKTLTRRRAITPATTHLGALKQLAAETVGIVNASLQFDAETLTPTYRLLKGVPGRSYGLAIARRLGVSEEVLAEAERGVPEAERTLDRLLAAVEARGRDIEARAAELEDRAAQLELQGRELADLESLEAEMRAREKALDKDARARARAYLLEARKTVEAALGQARAAVNEATAREARRMVEEAIEKTGGKLEGGNVGMKNLKIGDRVRTGQGKVGVVKEVRDNGRVVVEVGAVRLVINSDLLEVVESPSNIPTVPRSNE